MSVSRYRPKCPIIIHDEFTAITQVWDKLHEMGYRRIGVILPDYPNSFTTDLRQGAILNRRIQEPSKKNRIPILYLDARAIGFPEVFEPWFKNHRPDVVIGHGDQISKRIQALGYRVPEDVAYGTYNIWLEESIGKVAGYFRDNKSICTKGLQLLNMMVRTSRVGSGNSDMVEMISGEWIDAPTLPKKAKA